MKNKQNLRKKILLLTILFAFCFGCNPTFTAYFDSKPEISNSCVRADVPVIQEGGGIFASEAMLYYDLTDICNFQTLVFSLKAGIAENDTIPRPPYSILGRFESHKVGDGQFSISKIETKFIVSSVINQNFKITGLDLHEDSTPWDVIINIVYGKTKDGKVNEGVDDIYGDENDETAILIYDNASVSFVPVYKKLYDDGARPINGEYECNGKAITTN